MSEQTKKQVVQSNDLVSAHYKLDLLEQKLLRYLVSMIKPTDITFEKNFYRIDIQEFLKYIDWEKTGKIYKEIKDCARHLMTRPVKIVKEDETIETTWIASFRYPRREGWIEFEFSSRLESELLKLKEQFTKYYLKNIAKLKSNYSIRLYELVKQYVTVGRREIEIKELKDILGIDENKYKLFGHLKDIVIEKSAKEIIQKTDIDFKIKYIKNTRKVTSILFYDIQQKLHIPYSIITLIPKSLRDDKQVLNIIRKYIELVDENYVIEKINYTNSRKPKKWLDYFYKCLQQNWGTVDTTPSSEKFEDIKEGATIEIGNQKHIYKNNAIIIGSEAIPKGKLLTMILEGKAKIVSTE